MAYAGGEWADHADEHPSAYFDITYPPPAQCGLRTTEYLSYRRYKNLSEHDDAGSLYTVLFALSDPKDYEGGEYYIRENLGSDKVHYIKPQQCSAIVFLSESWHGVTDILSGHREMFTNELWLYEDPPWPISRPEMETMELFIQRYEDVVQQIRPGGIDQSLIQSMFPSEEDVQEWLRENGREGMSDGKYQPNYHGGGEFRSDIGDILDSMRNSVEALEAVNDEQQAKMEKFGELIQGQANLNEQIETNVRHIQSSQDETRELAQEVKAEIVELKVEVGKIATELGNILAAINELKESTQSRASDGTQEREL